VRRNAVRTLQLADQPTLRLRSLRCARSFGVWYMVRGEWEDIACSRLRGNIRLGAKVVCTKAVHKIQLTTNN